MSWLVLLFFYTSLLTFIFCSAVSTPIVHDPGTIFQWIQCSLVDSLHGFSCVKAVWILVIEGVILTSDACVLLRLHSWKASVFFLRALSEPSSRFLWGNEALFLFWTPVFSSGPTALVCPGVCSCPRVTSVSRGLCFVCKSCVGPFWESECFRQHSTHWSTRTPTSAASPETGALPSPFGQHKETCPGPVWTQAHGFYLGIILVLL